MKVSNGRVLAAVAIVVASLGLTSCAQAPNPAPKDTVDAQEQVATQTPKASESPQALNEVENQSPQAAKPKSGLYIPIEKYQSNPADYTDKKVVLFFNAAWCSTCKAARDNFEANLEAIPGDMAVVVVDFDDSDELRAKYGVTVQHTFVQVDEDGAAISKWSGSTTIAELVEQTT